MIKPVEGREQKAETFRRQVELKQASARSELILTHFFAASKRDFPGLVAQMVEYYTAETNSHSQADLVQDILKAKEDIIGPDKEELWNKLNGTCNRAFVSVFLDQLFHYISHLSIHDQKTEKYTEIKCTSQMLLMHLTSCM